MTPTRISEAERLIDSSRLTRNVGLSLGSQILPVVTAILLLPVLIGGLGDERFGVLALVWMIVGYFTLFDLGLSRALARYAAESLGNNRSHEVPAAFWTSLALMVATSVATAAISAAAVPWLVRDLLHLTGQLAIEAIDGFYVACATIPIVVVSGTLRGLLEAKQLFVQLTLVRIPSSVWNFLGPALLLPLTNALPVVIAALALGRVIALAALAKYVIRAYSGLWPARTERALISPLVSSGLWMTLSSLTAPLMLTGDRFLVASLVSVGALTFYATPYEAITRLWVITAAITTVLFPAFATSGAIDVNLMRSLYTRGVRYLMILLTPLIIVVVGFAHGLLQLWLGPTFATRSELVLQILAIGVLFSSFALVPFTLLQATARPAIVALLQVVELPIYLGAAFWAVQSAGIVGAAAAWTIRIVVDAALLAIIAGRALHIGRDGIAPFAMLAFVLPLIAVPNLWRPVVTVLMSLGFAVFAWQVWLSGEERVGVRAMLTAVRARVFRGD